MYLACAINFERDTCTGELWSCEPAISDHQEQCAAEAATHPEVRFALDPITASDWLAFFRREFRVEEKFELWRGDDFLGNVDEKPASGKTKKPSMKGVTCCPVYSLQRSSLSAVEADARQVLRRVL